MPCTLYLDRVLTALRTTPTNSPERLERCLSRHPLDLSEHLPYLINRVGSALVARFSAMGSRARV